MINALFDTLIQRDFFGEDGSGSGNRLTAGLAESWTREPDGSLLLELRKGVKFHNGTELTAEDVAFSFSHERLWGDEALTYIPNARKFSPDWEHAEIISRYKIRIKTKTPSFLLEHYLASWIGWIVPAAYYQSLGPDAFGQKPVGTGPYRFVEMRADKHIVLEAFEEYWGGRPNVTRLEFVAAPERSARIAGLLSGQYDIATTLTLDDRSLIDSRDGFVTKSIVVESCHLACFQQKDGGPASDIKVRQAMDRAIDRKTLNHVLWSNQADPLEKGLTFPSYKPEYYEQSIPVSESIEEAKRLIDGSGYSDETIVFNAYGNYFANNVNALMIMMERWERIGLKVRPSIDGSRRNFGKRDVFSWSHAIQLTDPVSPLVTEFGPGSYVQDRCAWAAPAEFNALCEIVKQTPDGAERQRQIGRLRGIFRQQVPALMLYRPVEVFGLRQGVDWNPISIDSMELRASNLRLT